MNRGSLGFIYLYWHYLKQPTADFQLIVFKVMYGSTAEIKYFIRQLYRGDPQGGATALPL